MFLKKKCEGWSKVTSPILNNKHKFLNDLKTDGKKKYVPEAGELTKIKKM